MIRIMPRRESYGSISETSVKYEFGHELNIIPADHARNLLIF